MNNKNLIVTKEESFGCVHGEHEFKQHSKIWNIRKTPCISYQASIESLSYDEICHFGRYLLMPTNIFNTETGDIKTTTESTARAWTLFYKTSWYYLTSKTYPIYDINNKYIGYVMRDKTYYTNLYKAKGNKYLAELIKFKKMICLLIFYFIIMTIILSY